MRTPKRNIVPLSVDEVARFWSSFRTSRDLAIVGLMLLQGLRSKEVLALNQEDLLSSEAQLRVRGKGSKIRSYRWLRNRFNCWITTCGWTLFLSPSKGLHGARA